MTTHILILGTIPEQHHNNQEYYGNPRNHLENLFTFYKLQK
jgi:G:T/U-mismatch repair DNA glycosylase